MTKFSERFGFTPIKQVQLESMDSALRNGLWSAFSGSITATYHADLMDPDSVRASNFGPFFMRLWDSHYKLRTDELPLYIRNTMSLIRDRFIECPWYEAFNFLEFVLENPQPLRAKNLEGALNAILEREVSAYRIIDGQVTPVIGRVEIGAIEEAIAAPLDPVAVHVRTALRHFSDRQNPDFRNSVKETISGSKGFSREEIGQGPVWRGIWLPRGRTSKRADVRFCR